MALTYLCLFGLLAFAQAGLLKFEPRIVNGEDAKKGEIPYQVSLQQSDNNFHFCGGSIVNKNYVVTAAHCVEGRQPGSIKVIAGTIDLKNPQSTHQVERIIVHEKYTPSDSWINDIALLKVRTPFLFSDTIQSVLLPPIDLAPAGGEEAIVSGFGRLWEGGPTTTILQKVKINIADQDYCVNKYVITGYNVYPSQICAFDQTAEKGSCHGDSGGPLIVKGYLVGLVSWAKGCASMYYPTVYTRVTEYVLWLWINMTEL